MSSTTAFPDTPNTFRISPVKMRTYRKRFIVVFSIANAAAMLFVAGIIYFRNEPLNISNLIVPMVAILAVGVLAYYANMNRLTKLMESYELIWDTLTVTRRQKDTPDVVLYHGEITGVEYLRKGGLIIKGREARDFIMVPRSLERYEEMKTLLEEVAPMQPYSLPGWLLKGGVIIRIVGLLALFFALITSDRGLIVPVGAVAICLNAWSLYQVYRSKNIQSRTKRLRFIRLILVLALLLRMYLALIGDPNYVLI